MSLFGDLIGQQGQVPVFISTLSPLSIGGDLAARAASAPAATAWTTGNTAVYIPFTLPHSATIVKLWAANGDVVGGNCDIGIYNDAGTRQVSAGSTAQIKTSNIQEFDITDTTLVPGRYYLAYNHDGGGSGRVMAIDGGAISLQVAKSLALLQQAVGAVTLPASATFAVWSTTRVCPLIGLSLRTQVE